MNCSKKGCTDPMSLAYNAEAKKDDGTCTYPVNAQKALVFKATGTWCPYCGSWGQEFSDDLAVDFPGYSEIIALHASDEFSADINNNLLDYLDPSGYPHFFVGANDVPNSYSSLSSEVTNEISSATEVSMALSYTVSDGVMNVKVQTQVENSFAGENCFLAVYVMENGQVATQQIAGQSADDNFVHNHILRTEATGSTFGQSISFEGGKSLTEVSATLAPSILWNHDNCYALAVLWKKDGSDYEFLNFAK
jgi:hypothetical protein